MKHKKYVLIIIFIVACILILRNIGKDEKIQYTTITLEKEPEFICPSNDKLFVMVVDGEIVTYNSKGERRNIELELDVAEAYLSYNNEWSWVIDTDRNLYRLSCSDDDTYSISDIVLSDVRYLCWRREQIAVINSEGDLYVCGTNECGNLGIAGERYIYTPQKVDYIENVEVVKLYGNNSALLTESGELYVAGANYDHSRHTNVFEMVEINQKVVSLDGCTQGYAQCDDGSYLIWECLDIDSKGIATLEEVSLENEFYNYEFEQINGNEKIHLALDTEGNLYYWGEDFMKKMENKADYEIHSTPQLIDFPKKIEEVYATYDAAFLKNGLEVYILTRQK